MATRPLTKILVANRGEIACRILRTLRALGKESVAVYSDADVNAPHVRLADEAWRLGPAPPSESYLSIPAILEAARASGADAIHPGYGFLSENAAFARAVEGAGLVFIGPQPEVIEAMGSKAEAKALMAARGVPVVPGYSGEDQTDARLMAEAEAVGYPLLVKASAGGGGKGMRVVEGPEGLKSALHGARREAKAAFGDDRLLLERYVQGPRHIEVQIFGDGRGEVVHLHERECSIQRRHQKVIEESPSPAIGPTFREALCKAGVRAGEALSYRNAGTVEFIVDASGDFFFLEVNTRLQVEHPVTEVVTGLDLVALQIALAEGGGLPEGYIPQDGHAIECRIYAEDPAEGFLPATGTFKEVYFPEAPWLRVDGGVATGDEASIHYDPMLAKVITSGDTRAQALDRMAWALARIHLPGVRTNVAFLADVMAQEAFRGGRFTTHFIPETYPGGRFVPPSPEPEDLFEALVVALLVEGQDRRQGEGHLPDVPTGWRNNRSYDPEVTLNALGSAHRLTYRTLEGGALRVVDGERMGLASLLSLTPTPEGVARLARVAFNGRQRTWRVLSDDAVYPAMSLCRAGFSLECAFADPFPDTRAAEAEGGIGAVATMPGKVLEVGVKVGDRVAAGDVLVVVEAMKMEHTFTARGGGVVTRVRVEAGETVGAGDALVDVTPDEDAAGEAT